MPARNESFQGDVVGTIFEQESSMPDYNDCSGKERRSLNRGCRRLPIQFFARDRRACHEGVLINGSEGGAFIETNDALPLLTQIRVEGPGIVFDAEVCRVHWLCPEERSAATGGMAVRRLAGAAQFWDADYEDDDGPVLSIVNAQPLSN